MKQNQWTKKNTSFNLSLSVLLQMFYIPDHNGIESKKWIFQSMYSVFMNVLICLAFAVQHNLKSTMYYLVRDMIFHFDFPIIFQSGRGSWAKKKTHHQICIIHVISSDSLTIRHFWAENVKIYDLWMNLWCI